MTTAPDPLLRIEVRWALLYGTEDDGERYDTRAGAEDRVEEIREGMLQVPSEAIERLRTAMGNWSEVAIFLAAVDGQQ